MAKMKAIQDSLAKHPFKFLTGLASVIIAIGLSVNLILHGVADYDYIRRSEPAASIDVGISSDSVGGKTTVGLRGTSSHAEKKDHSVVPALNGHVDE